jgi:4-amino-4-deoxy-L-arabinose transferase-like glycosyltransferase
MSYRLLQAVIGIFMIILEFKLIDSLNLNKIKVFILITLYNLIFNVYGLIEYNVLDVVLLLLIMWIELEKEKSVKRSFLIGLILGISTTIKQSTGLCMMFFSMLAIFLYDKDLKEKFKLLIARILAFLAVLFVMVLYLLVNNCFYEFLDYTIFGLKNFSSNTFSYLDFLLKDNYYICQLLSILFIFGYVFVLYKVIRNKERKEIILFLYSASALSIMYPIIDAHHILKGYLPSFILLIYYIVPLFKETEITEKAIKLFKNTLNITIVMLIIVIIINAIYMRKYNSYNHYKFINLSSELEDELEIMEVYLSNNSNAYIVDGLSQLFMIPIDRYNGILDLIFEGNTGSTGENKVIEEIEKLHDVYLLVQGSENLEKFDGDQNPIGVIRYIENSFEYVEKVGRFFVYYKE